MLVAIVFREPGYEDLVATMAEASGAGVGTPSLAETGLVLAARLGRDPSPLISRMLTEFGLASVPFSEQHWSEAVRAFARFGRGRHPARLNFGDCMSYATAKVADEPLLFVGNDFAGTDIRRA